MRRALPVLMLLAGLSTAQIRMPEDPRDTLLRIWMETARQDAMNAELQQKALIAKLKYDHSRAVIAFSEKFNQCVIDPANGKIHGDVKCRNKDVKKLFKEAMRSKDALEAAGIR